MKYCSKCGASIEDESLKFCPQCGNNLQATVEKPVQTTGMTDNIASFLCYIAGFITGIIFLVLEPYNRKPIIRFHAFQSIFYNIAVVVLGIVLFILGFIFTIAGLWFIFFPIDMIIWLGIIVLWILLMIWAYQGKKISLPIIGGLAEKQASGE